MLPFYTETAVYIGPNMKPLVGRDQIKAGMVDDGTTLLTLQADEIEVNCLRRQMSWEHGRSERW